MKNFDDLVEMFCQAARVRLSKNKHSALQIDRSMKAAKRRAEAMLLREVYDMSFAEVAKEMNVACYTARRYYIDAMRSFKNDEVLHDLLTS